MLNLIVHNQRGKKDRDNRDLLPPQVGGGCVVLFPPDILSICVHTLCMDKGGSWAVKHTTTAYYAQQHGKTQGDIVVRIIQNESA